MAHNKFIFSPSFGTSNSQPSAFGASGNSGFNFGQTGSQPVSDRPFTFDFDGITLFIYSFRLGTPLETILNQMLLPHNLLNRKF